MLHSHPTALMPFFALALVTIEHSIFFTYFFLFIIFSLTKMKLCEQRFLFNFVQCHSYKCGHTAGAQQISDEQANEIAKIDNSQRREQTSVQLWENHEM